MQFPLGWNRPTNHAFFYHTCNKGPVCSCRKRFKVKETKVETINISTAFCCNTTLCGPHCRPDYDFTPAAIASKTCISRICRRSIHENMQQTDLWRDWNNDIGNFRARFRTENIAALT